MITYSPASSKDVEEISELFLDVYSGLLRAVFKKLPNKNIIRDVMNLYLETSKGGFILAKDKGKIIGFVCGVRSVANLWKNALKPKRALKFLFTSRQIFIMPPRPGHIFHSHIPLMGVSKRYRLKGVGLKLSGKVLGFLKRIGAKVVYFQIPLSLVDIYIKHGCELLKKNKNWAVMRKML